MSLRLEHQLSRLQAASLELQAERRDKLAAAALTGFLARGNGGPKECTAKACVAYADLIIKELDRDT